MVGSTLTKLLISPRLGQIDFCCLTCSSPGGEEALAGTDQQKPHLSSQMARKGTHSFVRQTLENKHCVPDKHHIKTVLVWHTHTHISEGKVGNLDFHPPQACKEGPQLPCQAGF